MEKAEKDRKRSRLAEAGKTGLQRGKKASLRQKAKAGSNRKQRLAETENKGWQ
jgi:hypothetical protein